MMTKPFFVLMSLLCLASCAHSPKCGNPDGARVVLVGEGNCQVRIRQVTVGSELKIPASLKRVGLAQFSLEWVEPDLKSGQIELGHFVLVPESNKAGVGR